VRLGVEREVGKLHRPAIQPHQTSRLAENRGELIHDAAIHTAIVMFGRLADPRQFEFVDATVVKLVQCKSISRFQRRRRRHTGTKGHIAGKDSIETTDFTAPFLDFATNTENIAGPAFLRLVLLVQTERALLTEVERISIHLVRSVEPDGSNDTFVDSTRKDESAVVIRMLANQIDASGRSIQGAGVAEAPGEVAVDFTLKCIHKQVFKFN